MANEQLTIPVGYVRRAHGIGGDVVIRGLVSDASDRFSAGATLRTGESNPRTFAVRGTKPHKGDYIMTLDGVGTREAAEGLVGVQFVMAADERRTLGDDEWWPEEIIGCEAVSMDGTIVGTVSDVVTGAAQDRLVITPQGGSSFEVPFVDALVPDVLIHERKLTVDLPEGLVP